MSSVTTSHRRLIENEIGDNVFRAILIVFILKMLEHTVRNLCLVGTPGILSPHIWARSRMITSVWNVKFWYNIFTGREKFDLKGGSTPVDSPRISKKNIFFCVLFLSSLIIFEASVLVGSLPVQNPVDAGSVKMKIGVKKVKRLIASKAIGNGACEWFQPNYANFKSVSSVGLCPSTKGDRAPDPNLRSTPGSFSFSLARTDSSLILRQNSTLSTSPPQKFSSNTTLSTLVITPSSTTLRITVTEDTPGRVYGALVSLLEDELNCNNGIENGTDSLKRQLFRLGRVYNVRCDTGMQSFAVSSDLITFVSGSFAVFGGGVPPWEGSPGSNIGNPSTELIGYWESSRSPYWLLLVILVIGLVTSNLSDWLLGDDELIGNMIVVQTLGGYCCADPFAAKGRYVSMRWSASDHDPTRGFVGIYVPNDFTETSSLRGRIVQ